MIEYVHGTRKENQSAQQLEGITVTERLNSLKDKKKLIDIATHDHKKEVSRKIEAHRNHDGTSLRDSLEVWHTARNHEKKAIKILEQTSVRESAYFCTVDDFTHKGLSHICNHIFPDWIAPQSTRKDDFKLKVDEWLRSEYCAGESKLQILLYCFYNID